MMNEDEFPARRGSLVLKKIGRRSAWVEENAANAEAENQEAYQGFKQGADLMPRTAMFVDVVNENAAQVAVSVRTASSELANKQAKRLQGRRFTGTVNRKYLFSTITSNMLLPFIICKPEDTVVVLPIDVVNDRPVIVSDDDLMNRGDVSTAQWFRAVDQAIEADAQLKGKSLRTRIDVRGKLTQQTLRQDAVYVFVGAGGEKPTAAVEHHRATRPLITDQTTYVLSFDVEDEAYYVAGLINSSVLQEQIGDFQPEGLFGKRHIHKLPFQVIPKYNPDKQTHRRVVELSRAATDAARAALTAEMCDLTRSVSSRRRRLVRQVAAQLSALNEVARAVLLPQGNEENP